MIPPWHILSHNSFERIVNHTDCCFNNFNPYEWAASAQLKSKPRRGKKLTRWWVMYENKWVEISDQYAKLIQNAAKIWIDKNEGN